MLNLTCTFCRNPINLSDGDLAIIVDEVGDGRQKSYLINCPNCRRGNKVPMQRIQQAWKVAGSPAAPEIPDVDTVEEGGAAA